MRGVVLSLVGLLGVTACGSEGEMQLVNRLNRTVGLEVRAPNPLLAVDCSINFRDRYCAEQYESLGVIDFGPNESRPIVISDEVSETQCSNVLWLRFIWLGPEGDPDGEQVGPIEDAGTLVQLPAVIEVEEGAGALHQAAFPDLTARLDQAGAGDGNQDRPPVGCP